MRRQWFQWSSLFRRRQLDGQLEEEIRVHLEMLEEQYRGRGMNASEARAAARREFGGVEAVKETYREQRGVAWIEILLKDLGHAARTLARSPGITLAAVLSLALGIGANSAIFSLYHKFLMQLLPVERPDELALLYKKGGWGLGFTSFSLYEHLKERKDLFEGVLARSSTGPSRIRIGRADKLESAGTEMVSGEYFSLLGLRAAHGRLLGENDNLKPHAHPVAVLSYDYWQSRFGGSPDVLGQVLVVDDQPLTVVGVAQPGFRGLSVEQQTQIWYPVMMCAWPIRDPGMNWLWLMARVPPGRDRKAVQAGVDVAMMQFVTGAFGNKQGFMREKGMEQRLEVRPGDVGISFLRERFGEPLRLLLAAVVLVLLVACANIANLLLARGATRRREMAVRLSLGATRARLVRQCLLEALLLGVAGTGVGLAVAWWGQVGLLQFLPTSMPITLGPALHAPVLWFTALVGCGSVLLFGLAPALRVTAVDPAPELKAGAGRSGSARIPLRRSLVVVQVAFSVVLVAMAGLFAHSLAGLRSIDLGFHHFNVLTFELDFPAAWKPAQKNELRDRLQEKLAAIPGVQAVSYGAPGPYQSGSWRGDVEVDGRERKDREHPTADFQSAGPNYFATIGTTVLRGREFNLADTRGTTPVVVVNEAFERKFLEGRDAVGRGITHGATGKSIHATIVGVVRDVLHQGLTSQAQPIVYVPGIGAGNNNLDPMMMARTDLRGEQVVSLLRREVPELTTDAPVTSVRTLQRRVDDSIYRERLTATLSLCFGALALLLAALGLYGVLAYTVAQRWGEIGIRMALGAPASGVRWLVLSEGLRLIGLGLVLGLPLALLAGQAGASLLYGVKAVDPLSLGATVAVLLGIGALAAWLPARRASSITPLDALRSE